MANEVGKDPIVMLGAGRHDKNDYGDFSDMSCIYNNPSFEDWLLCLISSNYVITDSFHGTCFSVIFKKPFISLKNRNRLRFESLASMFGYRDQESEFSIYESPEHVYANSPRFKSIDFENAIAIIKEKSKSSLEWLRNALFSEKQFNQKCDDYDIRVQYANLWRNHYKQKQDLDALRTLYWKEIIKNIVIPSGLIVKQSDMKNSYLRVNIERVDKAIHYEFQLSNQKLYLNIHCESSSLAKKIC